MSDEKRFGPGNQRLGGEGDPNSKVTSSRARNRTVMLTPEMTGHVRALLYNDEGQADTAQEASPLIEHRPDPVNDIISSSTGWNRPERPEPPMGSGFGGSNLPDFGAANADPSLHGGGFQSGGFAPNFETPSGQGGASQGNRGAAFGSPTIQSNIGQAGGFGFPGTAPFQGSAGAPPARGLAGVQPPKNEVPVGGRKERATDRYELDPSFSPPASQSQAPAPQSFEHAVQPQRRSSSGKVIGFLVSFDSDENGECFDIRSGRLLITCRPTDQGDYILINHETISPLHAIIRATKEGKVEVLDQLSEYGTGIIRSGQEDEIEVAGARMVLQHGDVLRFGERRFIVCLVPSVKSSASKSTENTFGGHEESAIE